VAKAIKVNNLMPHAEGSEDDGNLLDDLLTDERSKPPEEQMIEADDLDRIFDRLDTLEDREASVIRMRFGLDPFRPMTLREVGDNLGLTRERVRQLEHQALQKLMQGLGEATGLTTGS
jgi:RNA polymerase primary sigma factor